MKRENYTQKHLNPAYKEEDKIWEHYKRKNSKFEYKCEKGFVLDAPTLKIHFFFQV